MARKAIKEKELIEFLHAAGCREITENATRAQHGTKRHQKNLHA